MKITHERISRLFTTICKQCSSSERQPSVAIVRQSQRRLHTNPNDRKALRVVAASSLVRNKPDQSLVTLSNHQHVLDNDAVASHVAGYACLIQNRPHLAKQHLNRSVELDPSQADCWNLLGSIAEQADELDGAERYYQNAILFENDRHDSALALSRLQSRKKRMRDAIHTLRVCLLRDQRSRALNLALAKLLQKRAQVLKRQRKLPGREKVLREAIRCYQIVNAVGPTAKTLIAEGVLHQLIGHFADAMLAFKKAVTRDPQSPQALTRLATALVDDGEIDQAINLFKESLRLAPQQASTHFRYSRAKKFRACAETSRYAKQLAAELSKGGRSNQERVQLHFAVAKVLDDTQHYDQAWHHYDQANRLKPGHSSAKRLGSEPTVRPSLQRLADHSIEFFDKRRFESNPCAGNPSNVPIFIVGMPRSGTTLTEQILSSHSQIAGAGELKRIDEIRHQTVGDLAYPFSLGSSQQPLRELADAYVANLDHYKTEPSNIHVTDKMPTNFMHLGMIAMLFPNAKIIHCRRNPMDIFVSSYCQNLNAPFCDLSQLVDYHHQYQRLMAHWHKVLPIKIHTVDYESLVTEPEPHSRALIAHTGLHWEPSCLSFHQNRRAVHTPSKWQVRQPMYSSSIQKWRRFEKHVSHIAKQVLPPN